MTNLKSFSVSQVDTYTSCARKWQLTYVEHVDVRHAEVSPTSLGDLVHHGLAGAFRLLYDLQDRGLPVDELHEHICTASDREIDAWSDKHRPDVTADNTEFNADWDDMVAGSKLLAANALERMQAAERLCPLAINGVPLVEFAIETPIIKNKVKFSGKIDLVAYDKVTHVNALYDFKVRARFTGPESETLAAQLALYQHVLRTQYKLEIPLAVVFQIKNAPPRPPTLNKNGTMSRSKITCDWPTYSAALQAAGLDPADYQDEMGPKLADVEFFRPIYEFRTPAITKVFWDNFVAQAKHIMKAKLFPAAYGYNCRGCKFAQLCSARLIGDDSMLFDPVEGRYTIYVKEVPELDEQKLD